ncbi:MAG: murein biosynthesis integral membrane protein MurJ [Anaerolineales bacterium]|nr:murein biosynthesis integral membrane protein MurJ [Anaerolineales bacterium]
MKPQQEKKPLLTHVARSSLLLAIFFTLDKLFGMLRQIVIGRQFGVSTDLDVFNAANNLPDLLFAAISGGALAVAFIPVLSQTLDRSGREELWNLFSRVANWAFLITALASVFLALFADQIVSAEAGIVPGFNREMQDLVADLMRLNLIATLIFSVSGLVSAGLQANQHFLLPALAPVLFDSGQIFGALVLAPADGYQIGGLTLPAFGLGIHGLVYGVILGAVLHLAIQVPGLVRFKFRWSPSLQIRYPGVLRVARLFAPRILTIGVFQLIFVVQDNLASRLDTGSITALAYGWLIMQVPETIFGTAIGTAIHPTLSEFFARKDDSSFADSVQRAIRIILALTIPSAVLLSVTIRPLIEAVFGFDSHGTTLVVHAARAYLLGLIGHSLLEIAARAFYARQNARIPLISRGLGAAVFVTVGILLYRAMGAAGIALSNSLAFTLETGLLLYILSRSFPSILHQRKPLLRVITGTVLGAAASLLVASLLTAAPLVTGTAALAVGTIIVVPFLLPELRLLRNL